MALLGAGAVGFVFYAMPDALFAEAVARSGLPEVLPAAQPPLGLTARIAAAAGGAILTFVAIWFLLRALAPKKPQPKQKPGPVEFEIAPPKLRKADAHPDAPARRPLFAGLDLGEPFGEPEGKEEAPLQLAAEPEPEPAPEAEPVAAESEFEPDSIHHLMQRLERGLINREGKGSDEVPGALPVQRPHEIDDRLRSAIDGLQQLARRG
jgi:hypothetical protein